MRIRNGCLFVVLAMALAALPTVALADGDKDKGGHYDIEGAWYGQNSWGNFTVSTITRTGPDMYAVTSSVITNVNPMGLGATRMTDFVGTLRRTGRNTYDSTFVTYYSDNNVTTAPYFGVMVAGITNGTAVQTGPNEALFTWTVEVSCNPCWQPGALVVCGVPMSKCDPARPWDPFNDPDTICLPDPLTNVSFKVPIDPACNLP